MSFSGKVKEELLEHYARARHCDIAELSAIVHMAGEFKVGHGGVCCLKVHTENLGVARKCFTLLVKTFNIKTDAINAPLIYALLQQTACTIVSRIASNSSPFA